MDRQHLKSYLLPSFEGNYLVLDIEAILTDEVIGILEQSGKRDEKLHFVPSQSEVLLVFKSSQK